MGGEEGERGARQPSDTESLPAGGHIVHASDRFLTARRGAAALPRSGGSTGARGRGGADQFKRIP